MISDDERREVARRLREIRPCKSGHIKWWEIARALGLKQPAGWFGWEKFEPDSVKLLADLIEPEQERTYHPERIGTAYRSAPMCSACKYPLDEVTVYCPHCGARLEGVSHGER